MKTKSRVSIIIPSWNGLETLKKSLPVVVRNSREAKIIVVDDGSRDATVSYLADHFPQIRVIVNQYNSGFTKSVNRGTAAADTEFIALINNDVYPQKHYLKSALVYFTDPDVAAVTFNEPQSSWPETSWHNGKLQYTKGLDKRQPVFSTWASGGSCLYRRSVWQQLGGFNPIYSPGYWEDIDLGWRTWKAGYKIIWAPKAVVLHRHESTFKRLNQHKINRLKERNELLFIWQNITDTRLIISHLVFLLIHSLLHPGYLRIIIAAFLAIPQAKLPNLKLRTDRQILSLVNKPLK